MMLQRFLLHMGCSKLAKWRLVVSHRKDITALESQAATLDLSELCTCCGRQIGGLPPASVSSAPAALPLFYLFPTGNAFHGACLAKEVMAAAAPQQQKAISALIKQLSQASYLCRPVPHSCTVRNVVPMTCVHQSTLQAAYAYGQLSDVCRTSKKSRMALRRTWKAAVCCATSWRS